jgi:small subunit ribosomal protein S9
MIAKAKTLEEKTPKKGLFFYATGKRKTVVARVKVYPQGKGEVLINGRNLRDYFQTQQDLSTFLAPFKLSDRSEKEYDVEIIITGGGEHARAEACRHGISKALVAENETRRGALKKVGFLTRDSRIKERKKPGLKRARRSPQWSKR